VIATWQWIALGSFVIAVLARLQYKVWRTGMRDELFFPLLEARITSALAAEHYLLTSKTHSPNVFGHRIWRFECPPKAIHVFWDGMEREIIVEAREAASPKPTRWEVAVIGIGTGSGSDRYQQALHDTVEAITIAVRAPAESPPRL
jgi:hypothetical protein